MALALGGGIRLCAGATAGDRFNARERMLTILHLHNTTRLLARTRTHIHAHTYTHAPCNQFPSCTQLQQTLSELDAHPKYPGYYLKPFHAYGGGNLNWDAAFEV